MTNLDRYLEEDRCTEVVERRGELDGFECYVVEQWACSRTHPTFVIATYTGDVSHTIKVGVLSVPTDEQAWSPRLKMYFKALNQYHARRRETVLGTLMTTNLSGFPSSLTVIPVPEGDVRKYRDLFFVNENLKRLGCSGRVGLKLTAPSGAAQAKFHQLYRTSDRISLYESVIELVKLCQLALMLFGKLEPEYADGLLCDMTEKAINDWWIDLGMEYYNIEPHDGILGPMTVAGLLGLLMGARNRLSAFGAPVVKDAFDVNYTKRGIAYFQKSQRLPKSRRLDRQTLDRLHRVTAKAASGEGWAMPRAVKSTVAELGGKGGEMVMDMVGARDKPGIADIETTDIERFTQLVQGERAKWLWYGKPKKNHGGDASSRVPGEDRLVFQKDDDGGYIWSGRKRDSIGDDSKLRKRDTVTVARQITQQSVDDKEQLPKKTVLKRATDRMTDARSGFERIKDVVGRRGHHHKPSIDEYDSSAQSINYDSESSLHRIQSAPPTSPPRPNKTGKSPGLRPSIETRESFASVGHDAHPPHFTNVFTQSPSLSQTTVVPEKQSVSRSDAQFGLDPAAEFEPKSSSNVSSVLSPSDQKDAGGLHFGDFQLPGRRESQDTDPLFRRRQSFPALDQEHRTSNEERWPRHLSFSIAEETILGWDRIHLVRPDDVDSSTEPEKRLIWEQLDAENSLRSYAHITAVSDSIGCWVDRKIAEIRELDSQAEKSQRELRDVYHSKLEEFQALRADVIESLARDRTELQEAAEAVEAIGAKLEYEINNLSSKLEDVNDSVEEFERQIVFVEERVKELEEAANDREGCVRWIIRMLTGLGRRAAPG